MVTQNEARGKLAATVAALWQAAASLAVGAVLAWPVVRWLAIGE